ncbi:hypothetical protein MT356_15945 [Rathayibacter festucae]|uniref:hypothetical protein n=1 Tax=Rathayibacter festucae TaxID=110937 RepID=UPI001FB500C9|nr:hypothetical protein [Rathayibacter festucae]MCJ1701204.1 hypothetical protein [Rathayibacter festucae]
MTPRHTSRRPTSGRRHTARALDLTVSAALSLVLLGGAATAAHADEASPAAPQSVTALSAPSPAATPGPGGGAPQASPAPGTSVSAEHPGLTGHFTGTFQKEDGDPVKVGTPVRWVGDLTNNGDVPLHIHGLNIHIAPGQTLPNVDVHQTNVTQADIDAGTITYAVEHTVTTPRGTRLTTPAITGSLAVPVEHPGIDGHFTGVLDTKDGEPVTAGTWITWTAELANTGDIELSTIDGIDVDLAPGETTDHFSWRSQVTQADLDAGSVGVSRTYDAVTVSGTRYTSGAVTGTLALPAPAERPRLSGEFEGHLELKNGEAVTVGTRITWIAYPVNSGDVELRNINDTTMVLTPGQPAPYYQVRAEVTQADLDAGSITFSRTFSGTTPRGTRYSTPFTGTLTLPTGPAGG